MFALLLKLRVAQPARSLQSVAAVRPQIAPSMFTNAPVLLAVRTFKVRTAVKKLCKDCYMVKRRGKMYVFCKSNNKHKQRQG
mgnify:CR=1 FL=1